MLRYIIHVAPLIMYNVPRVKFAPFMAELWLPGGFPFHQFFITIKTCICQFEIQFYISCRFGYFIVWPFKFNIIQTKSSSQMASSKVY